MTMKVKEKSHESMHKQRELRLLELMDEMVSKTNGSQEYKT